MAIPPVLIPLLMQQFSQIGPPRGAFPGQPGFEGQGSPGPFNAGAFHNFVQSPRTESPFKGLSRIGGQLGQFDQPPQQPQPQQLPPTQFGRSPPTQFPQTPPMGQARSGAGLGLPPELLRLLMGQR